MSSKFGTNYVTIFFPKGKNQHHLNFTSVVISFVPWQIAHQSSHTQCLAKENKYDIQSILLIVERKRHRVDGRDNKCVGVYNLLHLGDNPP